MPAARYDAIYRELRAAIEAGTPGSGELLPSEAELTARYSCSRNTIRRALALLADEGFVQAQHGKGVRVIWQSSAGGVGGAFAAEHDALAGLESFRELAERQGKSARNDVLVLEHIAAPEDIALLSGFEEGSELVHVVELRCLDEAPFSLDEHYYPADVAGDLTVEDASRSLFDYLEHTRGVRIATSKRIIEVVEAEEQVCAALGLTQGSYAVRVTSQTYSIEGRVVELTISYDHPAHFRFAYTATRKLPVRR